jgi:hypothetical protein
MSIKIPGLIRRRFRENQCPEFGHVRPVHLDEIVSMERRLRLVGTQAIETTRLGWVSRSPLTFPKVGGYISVHLADGKRLMIVERVSLSCVCCPGRAMTFVTAADVEEAMPQINVCDCARKREWSTSVKWTEAPEYGLCRKVGSDSLLVISQAIKTKIATAARGRR